MYMTMTLYAWIVSLLFSGNLWDAGKHGKLDTANALLLQCIRKLDHVDTVFSYASLPVRIHYRGIKSLNL